MFIRTIVCTQKITVELSYGHFVHYYNGICHILEKKHAQHVFKYLTYL